MNVRKNGAVACKVALDLGNDGARIHGIVMSLGNNCAGVYVLVVHLWNTGVREIEARIKNNVMSDGSIMVNVRDISICGHYKFGLEAGKSEIAVLSKRAYFEDITYRIEIQLPGSNRLSVVPCTQKSGDCVPFTPFDGILLDFSHGPAVKILVNR